MSSEPRDFNASLYVFQLVVRYFRGAGFIPFRLPDLRVLRWPSLIYATKPWECIRVLSETEFYDDLKAIDIPVLVMHGDDDQICPYSTTGAESVKLLKKGVAKVYKGFPHGMPTTQAEIINADLLTFFQS